MEKISYQLRIDMEEQYYEIVTSVLELKSFDYSKGWSYEIIKEERENDFNIIEHFLKILDGKYIKLKDLGIESNDITIWLIYGYNNQCNLEFNPRTLEKMGSNGITLCISCYEFGY